MSRSITLLVLAALFFFAPFARAQETEDMQKLNTQAIAALQAGKYDEGSALLLRILKIPGREKDMGTAYNLACAYSLKGDVDKGFEWLERSVDWGWGAGTGQLVGETKQKTNEVMTRTDPDLENLRKDPRFEKIMERMSKAVELRESRRKQGEEYAATPAIYIPEKVQGLAEMPLLVVLHDAGSTKDLVIAGRWKQIADELGFALVAPSGKLLLGDEPAQGMTWFADRAEYKSSYWKFEKPITDAYSAFKKEHPIDKDRVVIAGEGMGGLVALNTAIGSPSWFKGVVALNGSVDPELMGSKAPTAGKMGLRVKLLVELDETSKRLKAAGDASGNAAKAIEAWSRSLQTWGVTGEVKTVPADPDANPATMNRLLVESVKAVLQREPAPAKDPAPAPPGKGTDQ